MWINSPLGKWEQENRVNKALDDAARMRAQEKDLHVSDSARRGSLLGAASAPLLWFAAATRETVQSIQIWLAAPSAQQE